MSRKPLQSIDPNVQSGPIEILKSDGVNEGRDADDDYSPPYQSQEHEGDEEDGIANGLSEDEA